MARRWFGVVALALVATLVVGSCSGDDDGGDDTAGSDEGSGGDGSGGDAGAEREIPGADVARPTVRGPLTEGSQDGPFIAMPPALAEQYGYVEDEYVMEGEATSYAVEGEQGGDGMWTVAEDATAPYVTRILVRHPEDPEAFDGTVFVEWLNVSAGIDADANFGLAHEEILREGSAWVGVSAQKAGIEGGGALSIPGIELQGLKSWDPERYGDLSHPGDQFSYDMFSQAAQAIWRPGDVDVLGGLQPEHVIATGESQSAARMVTYVDAVQPVAGIYDGFLIHSRGGSAAPLGGDASGAGVLGNIGPVQIRTDLEQPVLQFQTETDMFGVLGFHPARQDDSDTVRTWEVAGTAHADKATLDYRTGPGAADGVGGSGSTAGGDPGGLSGLCGSINEGPQSLVLRAAVHALRAWVVDGELPPESPRFEVDGEALARDERGIAIGGIRTAAVDAPVAVLSGESDADSIICVLFGSTTPFDAATLAELYPTHDDYVEAVTDATDAAVEAGFVLELDGDGVVAAAEDAPVPE